MLAFLFFLLPVYVRLAFSSLYAKHSIVSVVANVQYYSLVEQND